jgi:hypothetical protein
MPFKNKILRGGNRRSRKVVLWELWKRKNQLWKNSFSSERNTNIR